MIKNRLVFRLVHVEISSKMFITFLVIFMTRISKVKEKVRKVFKFLETVGTLEMVLVLCGVIENT